jgi:hypothetical protein
MIFVPDAFLGQPLAWAGNQAAHALLIGAGIFALAAVTPLNRRQAFWAALALYGVWEVYTFAGDFLDAATDWSFVAMGAAFGWAAWEGNRDKLALAFAGIVLAAAAGVWVRLS